MKITALLFLTSLVTMCASQCPRKECIYNNRVYQEGVQYTFSCFILVCRSGSWTFIGIDSNCPMCYSCNDPHFKTFDNTYYDWHGKCNYTLSQPYDCSTNCSYFPDSGVYADFGYCYPGSAISCVDSTTYKVDLFTAVTITHSLLPGTIKINGNTIIVPTTPTAFDNCSGGIYPVIIWKDKTGCVYIIGKIYTVKVCGWCAYVYYSKSENLVVGGLCGYYTGDGLSTDDYTMRESNCQVSPTIPPFAISWTTQQQKDEGCCHQDQLNPYKTRIIAICDPSVYYEKCKLEVTQQMEEQRCKFDDRKIDINTIIEDCVEDCCADEKGAGKWLENSRNVTKALCDDELKKSQMLS